MQRPAIPAQIGKLLPLLASDKDGEVVAAANAICRTLAGVGLDLHDVAAALPINATAPHGCAASPPSFFDLSRAVRDADGGRLSIRERQFVLAMCQLGNRSPSPRQATWLADLHTKLSARAAA